MADKPDFDPTQPYQTVGDKPAFDPSQPFQAADGASSATGVAKSLGTGLAQGAIGLVGGAGDIGDIASRVGSKLPDLPASSPDTILGRLTQFLKDESAKSAKLPAAQGSGDLPGSYVPPTSAQIQKSVEGVTGPFYQPQGTAEDLASKVGQFAPALIGGPETLLAKGLTRVAAPAVASEAAGKLTEGTAAQPYAEAAGALLGAGGATAAASKIGAMMAARQGASLMPTALETKAASQALYRHPDVAAVQIKPAAMENLADTITSDLQHGPASGFRPSNEKSVFDAVNELRAPIARVSPAQRLQSEMNWEPAVSVGSKPSSIADIDNVRQILSGLAKEKDTIGQPTRQAAAASRAIDHIDNFLPNLKQPDLIAGDAAKANAILDDARKNWAAYKNSSLVQTKLGDAELNAASANSGGNIQNSIKQQFKPLLKNNASKVASWSDDEKAALNNIVRGTWTGSAARSAGNLLGGGGGLGMLAGGAAGYEAGGLPGVAAGALAGRAFKMIGNRSTFNAVQKLDTLIRSKSPEALRIAAANPQIAAVLPQTSTRMLRTMILAEPALRDKNQPRQAVGYANP